MPNLNEGIIRSFPLHLPPFDVQRQIAKLLSNFDDKIELNRRMNETLEAMARALFKDWFVDFGPTRAKAEGRAPYLAPEIWDLFPDQLDNEGKPVGWARAALGDLFDVTIGRTPPRKEREHFLSSGTGQTWLSIKRMGELQVFAGHSDEDLSPAAVRNFRVPIVPRGTVLVSFKLTVGRVAIASDSLCTNEAIAHLVSNDRTPVSNLFTYCFMKGFDYDQLGSTSSIATAVNSKSIKGIEMLIPSIELNDAFRHTTEQLFRRIEVNTSESETLAQTRDLLLPKLMSGEIRLKDAEKIAAEVA